MFVVNIDKKNPLQFLRGGGGFVFYARKNPYNMLNAKTVTTK
jgi:hypothetical protein